MAYFLFIDESGQDHKESPYEVLAGVSIQDADLWNLVRQIQQLELLCFGRRYREDGREIKAKKFLNKKVFRLAAQLAPIEESKRTVLAKAALDNGEQVSRIQLTALAQAKIDYVRRLLLLCQQYRCKLFASIICDHSSIPIDKELLRKDYIYLFERFYYFLEDKPVEPQGIVVFDELDKTASHVLLSQMERYFKHTFKGRNRSSLVIPEPFFVHSDLTTGIQIVDFVAYILSWNFRNGKLLKPARQELNIYAEQLMTMRYRTIREIDSIQEHVIWSITVV